MESSQEHIINLPRRVYVGFNILQNLKGYFKSLSLTGPYIIVTGPHVKNVIKKYFEDSFFEPYAIIEVERATLDEVTKVMNIANEIKANVILGVGGGKSIDVAKYSAFKSGLDFVSIPTAPSHDGITSPFASLKGLEKPVSVKAKEPLAIIADINIISGAPKRLISAGIGDSIGKIIAVRDWKLAAKLRGEYYGDYTASLALMSAKHAISTTRLLNKNIKEAVRNLIEALISSGIAMGMAGSTRPASGSEHLFAHAIEMLDPNTSALHGELVALGTIMMAYIHGINWMKIKKHIKRAGLPTTAKELGLSDELIIKALTIAHTIRPERYTILGDKGITWNSAEKIVIETGIID